MPSVTDQGIVGYMFDNGNAYPYYMPSARIITGSCNHMGSHFADGAGKDDAWLIFPGYTVTLYTGYNRSGNSFQLDNRGGDYPKMFHLKGNKTYSFAAHYKSGVQLPDISSETHYQVKKGMSPWN